MEVKTVGVACDHAGFALKKFVLQYLEEKGYPVKDYGTGLSWYRYLRQRRGHQHDAEQAPTGARRTLLDS